MATRILVAEDISAHAKVMRCNLAAAGYDVVIAGDGRQAWLASQHDQFDIVITDYKMPYLTGVELCRLLRQDRRYANTPIILVTSYCEELDMDLIRARFFLSAIMEKPISAAKLTKKVEDCLAASAVAV
jgi:CheY-like chemotaxis protein